MPSLRLIARRAVGLFNVKKAPMRAKIAQAWIDQRIRQSDIIQKPSFAADLKRAGVTFDQWHPLAVAQARTFASAAISSVDAYMAAHPERVAKVKRDAETVLGHQFDLLGSGPYHPRCPYRAPESGGYQPINWAYDPIRNVTFPEGFHYKEWDLFRDRPPNADVKFPWELARCQHFLTLAQAWRVTGEARFVQEILDEIRDFHEKNPPGTGVNWTCTMDVGIRAANWAIALDLINNCEDVPEEQLFDAYSHLFDHGHFIRANLENTYETTSNHYLSNVVGLHFIGAFFQDLPTGKEWIEFSSKSVQKEIDVQVLPDGADFESSVPYHRLVIELFLGSHRLAAHLGRPFSSHFTRRLGEMMDYLCGVLLPNGEMPVFGDADDGRLMIATDYCDWNRKDARHLFAPASLALSNDDLRLLSPGWGAWEAIWWGFDISSFTPGGQLPGSNVKLYPQAGAAVSRTGDGRYLLVTNSIVGTVGFGNHKHNEQLSFELHDEYQPLIVDPGSWVYTSDFEGRNLHRSTAYHNTVMIDGVEQNEFNSEWLFRMFEKANPEHLRFEHAAETVIYEGLHRGYETQLEEPVLHHRRFEHNRSTGALSILDTLTGTGRHSLVWSFHFHPSVTPQLDGGQQQIHLRAKGKTWVLSWDDAAIQVSLDDTWFSPSYGVREPTKALRLAVNDLTTSGSRYAFQVKRLFEA
ncbi:MAG: hypothetical protein GC152_11990 [Alphaproteobacteria bacterium]|nr:hypothetical protein [Alphaproteobacteria bacterium]